MPSQHRPPSIAKHIIWAVSFAFAFPASLAATRIREITFDDVPEAPHEALARVLIPEKQQQPSSSSSSPSRRRAGGGGGTLLPLLLRAVVLGAIFVVADERGGTDILYRMFGLDVLPKTAAQVALRRQRALWREVRASGDAGRVREVFFQLRRERYGLAGLEYEEEAMRTPPPPPEGRGAETETGELLDPQDVRVFYILSSKKGEADNKAAARVCMAFNVDPDGDGDGDGVRDRVERTTRWILGGQVQARLAEGGLEMPCRLERVYRDGESERVHLLQPSSSPGGDGEEGSPTLADAWDHYHNHQRV